MCVVCLCAPLAPLCPPFNQENSKLNFAIVLFVGDAYSVKTFQSMTSLATSPAISSYSLYSNGFVVTGPEDSRSQSVNNLNNYANAWQMQHLSAADSMPMNGRGKRHSYSSDSDSRNRLDLDKALEALQSQQLQLRHENHRTVSAPPQQQYQQQYIVQNGRAGGGGGASAVEEQQQRNMQSLKRNVHKHKDYQLVYNAPIAAPADDDVNDNGDDDDDDALSVENTRL